MDTDTFLMELNKTHEDPSLMDPGGEFVPEETEELPVPELRIEGPPPEPEPVPTPEPEILEQPAAAPPPVAPLELAPEKIEKPTPTMESLVSPETSQKFLAELEMMKPAGATKKGVQPISPEFDPEGIDYDYKSAEEVGMKPDETGHWASRRPYTDEESEALGLPPGSGLILKGKSHETWNKTLEGEASAGYVVVRGEGNRYYSVPAPQADDKMGVLEQWKRRGEQTLGDPEARGFQFLPGSSWEEQSYRAATVSLGNEDTGRKRLHEMSDTQLYKMARHMWHPLESFKSFFTGSSKEQSERRRLPKFIRNPAPLTMIPEERRAKGIRRLWADVKERKVTSYTREERKRIEDALFARMNKRLVTMEKFKTEEERRGKTILSRAVIGAAEMIPYMENIALGPTMFIGGETPARASEMMAGEVALDEEGKARLTKPGVEAGEAYTKGVIGSAATFYIEKFLGRQLGKVAGKVGGRFLPAGFTTGIKNLKGKIPLLPVFEKINKLTGFGSLTEEIFVEEYAEALVNAIGNLQNDYESGNLPPLLERLSDAHKNFIKAVPDMALAMMFLRGSQHAASMPAYLADRGHDKLDQTLNALGVPYNPRATKKTKSSLIEKAFSDLVSAGEAKTLHDSVNDAITEEIEAIYGVKEAEEEVAPVKPVKEAAEKPEAAPAPKEPSPAEAIDINTLSETTREDIKYATDLWPDEEAGPKADEVYWVRTEKPTSELMSVFSEDADPVQTMIEAGYDIEGLAEDIAQNGLENPIVVGDTIEGQHRILAANIAGMDTLPVIEMKHKEKEAPDAKTEEGEPVQLYRPEEGGVRPGEQGPGEEGVRPDVKGEVGTTEELVAVLNDITPESITVKQFGKQLAIVTESGEAIAVRRMAPPAPDTPGAKAWFAKSIIGDDRGATFDHPDDGLPVTIPEEYEDFVALAPEEQARILSAYAPAAAHDVETDNYVVEERSFLKPKVHLEEIFHSGVGRLSADSQSDINEKYGDEESAYSSEAYKTGNFSDDPADQALKSIHDGSVYRRNVLDDPDTPTAPEPTLTVTPQDDSETPISTYAVRKGIRKPPWQTLDLQSPEAKTLARRMSIEFEMMDILIGPLDRTKAFDYKGTKSMDPSDLAMAFNEALRDGTIQRLMDPGVPAEDLAADMGLKGKKKKAFLEEVRILRTAPLYDTPGVRSVLGDNTKTHMGTGFAIFTCAPTAPCKECYAARSQLMSSIPAVRKHIRNTFHIFVDPIGWGKRVALEAARQNRHVMPFIRLNDVGDLTGGQMLKGFNAVAENSDRPVHVFSRHHDMLARLKGTAQSPFFKMGSLDRDLYTFYGLPYLLDNMKERSIANAWLYTDPAEIPAMETLMDEDELPLILAASVKLHNGLPADMKAYSCPCDSGSRLAVKSCIQCALSNKGCYMGFFNKGIDADGRMWNLMDRDRPDEITPVAFNVTGDSWEGTEPGQNKRPAGQPRIPANKAWANVTAEVLKMKAKAIIANIRHYENGYKKDIVLKDPRFPDTVVRTKSKPRALKYVKRLRAAAGDALGGTFWLPGGVDPNEDVAYRDTVPITSPRAISRLRNESQDATDPERYAVERVSPEATVVPDLDVAEERVATPAEKAKSAELGRQASMGPAADTPAATVTDADITKYAVSRNVDPEKARASMKKDLEDIVASSTDAYEKQERYESVRGAFIFGGAERWQAAFKYGDTVSSIVPELVKDRNVAFDIRGYAINNPRDFAALLMPLRSPYFETMKVAFLDRKNRVIKSNVVTVGILDASLIHAREMMTGMPENTAGVVISHNHPSGDPSPSAEDIRITKVIVKAFEDAGINVQDHVITNGGTFFSFREEATVAFPEIPQSAKEKKLVRRKIKEPAVMPGTEAWETVRRSELPIIMTPDDIAKMAKGLRQANPLMGHAIYLNTKNRVVGVERMPLDISMKDFRKRITLAVSREGASGYVLDWPAPNDDMAFNVGREAINLSSSLDVKIYDMATANSRSTREEGILVFMEKPVEYTTGEEKKKAQEVREAGRETETAPTEAQKEAGNYAKGKLALQGMNISIENPKGSTRSGVDPGGQKWEQQLQNSYGYIKRTEGADGDQIDVFINDENPISETVFVVNQVNPKTAEFDEHKVMLGFENLNDATQAYLSNYQEGWQGLGSIDAMSIDEFKEWIKSDKPKNSRPAVKPEAQDARRNLEIELRYSVERRSDQPRDLTPDERNEIDAVLATDNLDATAGALAFGEKNVGDEPLAVTLVDMREDLLKQTDALVADPAKMQEALDNVVKAQLLREAVEVIHGVKYAVERRTVSLPTTVGPNPGTTTTKVTMSHPDFKKAKSGDLEAADRFVRAATKPGLMVWAKANIKSDDVIMPILAEEASGRNKIPLAFANYLSEETGADYTADIVQSVRAMHTGKGAMYRMLQRPAFDGPVVAGKRYWIVDDHFTMGGTIIEAANHIVQNGGEVAGIATISKSNTAPPNLTIDTAQAEEVRSRYGNTILQEFNIDPAALTASEGRYLLTFVSDESLRKRLAKVRDEIGQTEAQGEIFPRQVAESAVRYAIARAEKGVLFHVTTRDNLQKIRKEGLKNFQTTNWVDAQGQRQGKGEIFAFERVEDALRWGFKMDWDLFKGNQEGDVVLVKMRRGTDKWDVDTASPLEQAGAKGQWLKRYQGVPVEDILADVEFNKDMMPIMRKLTAAEVGDIPVEDVFPENTRYAVEQQEAQPPAETLPPEQEEVPPIWKSGMYETVENKLPGSVTGPQLVSLLESWARKGQLKRAELDDSGILDWARETKGKVSKADVLAELERRTIEVGEVMKGADIEENISNELNLELEGQDIPSMPLEWLRVADDLTEAAQEYQRDGNTELAEKYFRMAEEANIHAEGIADGTTADGTKFAQWQVPGGENYKELLLTLPVTKEAIPDPNIATFEEMGKKHYPDSEIRIVDVSESTSQKRYDMYVDDKLKWTGLAGDYDPQVHGTRRGFTDGHWDEPNVLAHIRFDERTTPGDITGMEVRKTTGGRPWKVFVKGEKVHASSWPTQAAAENAIKGAVSRTPGKKMLFIEEIQSDWHQQGRRRGYAAAPGVKPPITDLDIPEIRKLRQLEKEYNQSQAEAAWNDYAAYRLNVVLPILDKKLEEVGLGAAYRFHEDIDTWVIMEKSPEGGGVHASDGKTPQEAYDNLEIGQTALGPSNRGVPDAPFKKNWHELAMKRMFRHAVDNGFDSVGWTTGQQQADRYNLSNYIDAIDSRYDPIREVYNITMYMKASGDTNTTTVEADKLAETVGKDLAGKMIKDVGQPFEKLKDFVKELPLTFDQKTLLIREALLPIANMSDETVGLYKGLSPDQQKKIKQLSTADREGRTQKTYRGLDLKVGGEGMKSFYDKFLPAFAKKYTKKWGGKVSEETLAPSGDEVRVLITTDGYTVEHGSESHEFDNEKDADDYAADVRSGETVHSLAITPQMRESIKTEAQPAYAIRRREPETREELRERIKAVPGVDPEAMEKVVEHISKVQKLTPEQQEAEKQRLLALVRRREPTEPVKFAETLSAAAKAEREERIREEEDFEEQFFEEQDEIQAQLQEEDESKIREDEHEAYIMETAKASDEKARLQEKIKDVRRQRDIKIAEQKAFHREQKQRMRQVWTDRQARREFIWDYAKKHLEPGDREKVLNQIKAAAPTDLSMQRAIERIDRLEEQYAKKKQENRVKKLMKIVNRRLKAKQGKNVLRVEYADPLRAMVDAMDPTKPAAKTIADISKTKKFFDDHPELREDLPPRIQARIERLQKRPVGTMSMDELQETEMAILTMLKQNDLKGKFIGRGRWRNIEDPAREIIEKMQIHKRVGGTLMTRTPLEPGAAPERRGLGKVLVDWYDDIDLMARIMDAEEDGPASQIFYGQLNKAEAQRLEDVQELKASFRASLQRRDADVGKELYKMSDVLPGPVEVKGRDPETGEEITTAIEEIQVPETRDDRDRLVSSKRTLRLTPAQKISLLLTARDPDGWRSLSQSSENEVLRSQTEKLLRRGRTTRVTIGKITSADIKALDESLTERERSVLEAASEFFNVDSKRLVNEASRDLEGYDIAGQDNYFPKITVKEFIRRGQRGALPGATFQQQTLEDLGILKERQPGARAPVLIKDIFQVLEEHIAKISAYHAYAAPLRQIKSVFNWVDKTPGGGRISLENEMRKAYGPEWVNNLKDLIGRVEVQSHQLDPFEHVMEWLRSRTVGAILTGRPTVWAKQAISYPLVAMELGYGNMARSLLPLRGDRGAIADKVVSQSPEVVNRLVHGRISRDIGDYVGRHFMLDLLADDKPSTEKLSTGVRVGDRIAIRRTALAAYFKAQEDLGADASEEELMKRSRYWLERAIKRTQPAWHLKDLTVMGGSPSVAKRWFYTFRTFRDKVIKMQRMAVLRYSESDRSTGEKVKMARDLVYINLVAFLLAALVNEIWNKLRKRKKKYMKEKTTQDKAVDLALRTSDNLLGNYFLIGEGASLIVRQMAKKRNYRGDVLRSPVVETMNDLLEIGPDVVQAIQYKAGEDEEKFEAAMWRLAEKANQTAGRAIGVPLEGIWDMTETVTGGLEEE